MICTDALKLDGYLRAMADIQSMSDEDIRYDFSFERINFFESPEESFRSYCELYIRNDYKPRNSLRWIELGDDEEERINNFIENSYDQLLKFSSVNSFEKEMEYILKMWITNKVSKYSPNKDRNSLNSFILDYMKKDLGLDVEKHWKLRCDSDFVYDAFLYNLFDIYILRIANEYYLLRFGLEYIEN